jgi:hypothetical protein
MWQFWIGLIIGIVSVVLFVQMGTRGPRRRSWEDEEEADPTGEL